MPERPPPQSVCVQHRLPRHAVLAAGRLQALIDSRASGTSMAEMWVKMDRVINAVKSAVPEEMWDEIVRQLDGAKDRRNDEIKVFDPGD